MFLNVRYFHKVVKLRKRINSTASGVQTTSGVQQTTSGVQRR